ncbi:MAG TPA: winged helix-turn-helix domain-containing protein [Candidatus Acidoferrales bacterium]|nr:winged helix-turn-helix domain-containing protein [Candidatus Acidoferrales bacterium]
MGASFQEKRSCIRFGAFELDLQAGVLRKNGIRLRCQEQPLQVLAALVERPGELVTREELRHRVWPQDTFVDFDHALNTAIKKIRAALNDDAGAPRFIETVPRRGYRFVAQVESDAPESAAPSDAAVHDHGKYPRLFAFIGIGIVLLAILGLVWRLAPWQGEASTSPEFQRLTFDQPELSIARFTPDGASVVYSAGWQFNRAKIYAQRLGTSGPQQLGIANSSLLAVSPQAELAVLSEPSSHEFGITHPETAGTLARVPLEGGTPRELLPDAEAADWSPTGELAVVKHVGGKSRLEFPVGRVLYESTGWIATPRFSPRGDSIAFLDHPVALDDRGSVAIVDLSGNKKTLSGFWESLRGLAWNPRGDEIWFAATRSGVARALYAVTLAGRERRVLNVAGGLSLQDISRDGKVVLSRDLEKLGILFVGQGDQEKEPRELSWKDWSAVADISPDGKRILFGEEGENSGLSYQVGLRSTDGSAPVILGSGSAQSLSPDGKWALSIVPAPNDQIVLLPTGAGNPKSLDRGPVEHYQHFGARWFPNSEQIVFVGYEAGHGPRCYIQNIEGGKPRAFTPDGTALCSVSPNGQILELMDDARALLFSSVTSEQPEKVFKFEPSELPIGWTPDGKFLYLVQTVREPATITRLEIASGRRSLWKQLPPPPIKTIMKADCVVITPDGRSYAYEYMNHSSDLYLVQGLK